MSQIWSKGSTPDDFLIRFTAGQDHILDNRLVAHDVKASLAHVAMLAKQNHLAKEEASDIARALKHLAISHQHGDWTVSIEEEDCHTALENRLIAALGALGEKVHLGRSRNDQILVALRLFMLEAIAEIRVLTETAALELRNLATNFIGVPLPGYTHMQKGMPSSVTDWATAYSAELIESSFLLDPATRLARLCPLGSAAGYGTPGLNLDREFVAKRLGMKVQQPVTACQLSRGKAEAALAFAIVSILSDLGRLASDLCLYNTAEFGFVKLPEEMTTGSSIMPQKRNPDVFELVRAHSAVAPTELAAILAITTKLPSGYHRDLQLIKPQIFASVDRAIDCLTIMNRAIPRIAFQPEKCRGAMTPELYAAQEAFQLVQTKGMTFRSAYRKVAKKYAE